jgi:anti-anti-sigma regulatory factor
MLRISVIEERNCRRLVLEGKLIAPWAAELKRACETACADLQDRELVVDMKNLTVISQEGENVLLELMNQGVKFRCCGVFTKYVLRQLSRRMRKNFQRVDVLS